MLSVNKKRFVSVLLFVGSFTYAQSIEYTTYVTVDQSMPEYEEVIIQEPYQDCWDEELPERLTSVSHNSYRNDTTAAAIIGGVAGGILGHQIVHSKKAKGAATIGGAILGTLIGQNITNSQYARTTHHTNMRYVTRKKCHTKYQRRHMRTFRGYKNVAKYKGRSIVKHSNRPLKRIPLRVTVRY